MPIIDKDTVQELLTRHPRLHRGGYGGDPGAVRLPNLLDDLDQISLAYEWAMMHLIPRKTVNKWYSSYGLKHYAELDEICCGRRYISNGAMITAMLLAGFSMEKRPRYKTRFAISTQMKTPAGQVITPALDSYKAVLQLHPEATDINA